MDCMLKPLNNAYCESTSAVDFYLCSVKNEVVAMHATGHLTDGL